MECSVLSIEFINGFDDTANSHRHGCGHQGVVPRQAIVLASITDLVGALAVHAVAKTVSSGLVDAQFVSGPGYSPCPPPESWLICWCCSSVLSVGLHEALAQQVRNHGHDKDQQGQNRCAEVKVFAGEKHVQRMGFIEEMTGDA